MNKCDAASVPRHMTLTRFSLSLLFFIFFCFLQMMSCDPVQPILAPNSKWLSALYCYDSFLSWAAGRHFQAHAANTHKEHANLWLNDQAVKPFDRNRSVVIVLLISAIWVTKPATWQAVVIRVGRRKRGSIQGYILATGLDFKSSCLNL